jgi:hypothetical protein
MFVPKYRNYQKIATRSGLCLWCFKMRKLSGCIFHLNLMTEGGNVERSMFYKTYLLTVWSTVLLEKLTGFQLVKKLFAFYGTWRFITAFASACHLCLSWARWIQSIPSHSTTWRLFYKALVINILHKNDNNGTLMRDKSVNNSKSTNEYWHNWNRNM